MREGTWLAGLLMTCTWLGCAQSRPPSESSETHFLMRCALSCDDGLECICGTCSRPCDKDDACSSLPGAAQCLESASTCASGPLCDVECARDTDCHELSDSHICDHGRCRVAGQLGAIPNDDAGDPDTKPDASALPPPTNDAAAEQDAGAPSCNVEAVVDDLVESAVGLEDCGSYSASPSEVIKSKEAIDCVRAAIAGNRSFKVTWWPQAVDSNFGNALVHRVQLDVDAYWTVFMLDDLTVKGSPSVSWTRCLSFSLAADCIDDVDTCFRCHEPSTDTQCSCTGDIDDTSCAEPQAPIVPDPPPCEPGACLINGVCYPDGTTDESGCCSCSATQGSCIEPAWCDGQASIGKRCANDGECSAGLECRSDFAGERGVCTRPCNYGCPTGTECAAEVPLYDGGTANDMCMRPCVGNVDCSPFGSVCTQLADQSARYCF